MGKRLKRLSCWQICSAYDCVVPARGKAIVKTDLAISIPWGTYARIGKLLFASLLVTGGNVETHCGDMLSVAGGQLLVLDLRQSISLTLALAL